MIVSFPMWIDGRKRLLEDVVRMYPELLGFQWTVLEFDGSGHIPGGLHFYEFERIARLEGYPLEREELLRFVAGMIDVADLVMTATLPDGRSASVEAAASSEWTISISDLL
jgi:hypothetical protein